MSRLFPCPEPVRGRSQGGFPSGLRGSGGRGGSALLPPPGGGARPRALPCALRAFRWRHALPAERWMIDAERSQWAEGRQGRGALRLVMNRGIKGDGPALRPFFPGALVEVRARRGGSGARAGLGGRTEGSGPRPGAGFWAAAALGGWERWAPGRREGKGGDPPVPLFFLAGPSSSLNPPGDPWSTAEMPREDRATWKSNYFMKIIVSVDSEPWWGAAAAEAGSGQREPGGPACWGF